MIRATLRCDAVPISAPSADQKPGTFNAGRWRLNAGSRMLMCIAGLNCDAEGEPQPVGVILDMASAQIPERMSALSYHEDGTLAAVIGSWVNIKADGTNLDADLVLVDVENDREAAALPDAVRAKALIRAGVPLQASIGAGADYDELDTGDLINGIPFTADADDDMPTFAARMAALSEASLVLRGADSRTGQIAAKAANTPVKKDPHMSIDLKAMKAKYAGKSAEIRAAALDLATSDGATEAAVSELVHDMELKAAKAETDAAVKRADELADKLKASATSKEEAAKAAALEAQKLPGSSSGSGSVKVENWGDARALVASENPKLKGMSLNAEVSRRFPTLKASAIHPPGYVQPQA